VASYVQAGLDDGAKLLCGGRRARGRGLNGGFFFEPTIFVDVKNSMRIAQEEVFGPVLAMIPFTDEEDAIRIANDVVFGLVAAVWTKSLRRAMLLTDKLKAGTVWVNNYRATSFPVWGGYENWLGACRDGLDQGISRDRADLHQPRR
jgi:aldehyde dehydrogenase (NAD+)